MTVFLFKKECEELKGKFDHVRKITGTRMLIIDRYVKEYKNYDGKFKGTYRILFTFEGNVFC